MARSTFEPRTFAVNPDGIIELFINAKYMPIVASPYDGDELRVDYYTSPEYPYDAHIEDGIVIIECPQSERASGLGGMFNMFMSSLSGINWQQLTIKVYVPRSYYGMLNLCTSCASISAHSLELPQPPARADKRGHDRRARRDCDHVHAGHDQRADIRRERRRVR